MPYFSTSQEWFRQSSLLIQARPTTTRITTKYTLAKSRKAKKRAQRQQQNAKSDDAAADTAAAESSNAANPTPKAKLVLKTYDPESGVCLKYQTHKAPEVGRLIASLGRLGRHMAALPDTEATSAEPMDIDGAAGAEEHADKIVGSQAEQNQQSKAETNVGGGSGGGGGGGKKKKKGKK